MWWDLELSAGARWNFCLTIFTLHTLDVLFLHFCPALHPCLDVFSFLLAIKTVMDDCKSWWIGASFSTKAWLTYRHCCWKGSLCLRGFPGIGRVSLLPSVYRQVWTSAVHSTVTAGILICCTGDKYIFIKVYFKELFYSYFKSLINRNKNKSEGVSWYC